MSGPIEAPGFLSASGSSPPTILTATASSPILEAALDYIERRGWPVLPLYPRRKNPYQPAGYKELPPLTPDELRRYFDETPDLNIGMHTGHGILVIDVDEKPGKMSGSKALAALEAIYGPLPPTLNLDHGRRWVSAVLLPPTGLRTVRRPLASGRRVVALAP